MLEHGTTTVEAKSGYGLTTTDEVKCMEVMKVLNEKHPIDIVPTFLGAHAIPLEYKNNPEEYVNLMINEMIPEVASRKLAEFCDVFLRKRSVRFKSVQKNSFERQGTGANAQTACR